MNRIEAADAVTRSFCRRVQRGCSSFWFAFWGFVDLSLAAELIVGDDGAGALLAPARKLAAEGKNTAWQLPQRTRPRSSRSAGTATARHSGHCSGGRGGGPELAGALSAAAVAAASSAAAV